MTISFATWLRATFLGWILGVPLIVVLALAGEAAGIGGSQVLVGLGMGIGVGLMQGRAMRAVLGRWGPWMLSTAVGLCLPFLVADLLTAAHRDWPYSLEWCVAIGGLIVGAWQALLLRRRMAGAAWWVAASLGGWALAAATSSIGDRLQRGGSLRGVSGLLVYLGSVAVGGVVLGAITGLVLPRLMPRTNK